MWKAPWLNWESTLSNKALLAPMTTWLKLTSLAHLILNPSRPSHSVHPESQEPNETIFSASKRSSRSVRETNFEGLHFKSRWRLCTKGLGRDTLCLRQQYGT